MIDDIAILGHIETVFSNHPGEIEDACVNADAIHKLVDRVIKKAHGNVDLKQVYSLVRSELYRHKKEST